MSRSVAVGSFEIQDLGLDGLDLAIQVFCKEHGNCSEMDMHPDDADMLFMEAYRRRRHSEFTVGVEGTSGRMSFPVGEYRPAYLSEQIAVQCSRSLERGVIFLYGG